jgi:hypothetical protein
MNDTAIYAAKGGFCSAAGDICGVVFPVAVGSKDEGGLLYAPA